MINDQLTDRMKKASELFMAFPTTIVIEQKEEENNSQEEE